MLLCHRYLLIKKRYPNDTIRHKRQIDDSYQHYWNNLDKLFSHMKHLLSLFLTVSLLSTFAGNSAAIASAAASETTYVYICTGSSATKYHAKVTCRGLNNCRGRVVKISVEDAKEQGRTPCSICKPQ